MSFWINQQKKREERIQHFAIEKEREAIRIELNSIQQQFKPHFLFNSLNSIGALCISNPKEARKMIQLLSDFMRKAVRENENDMIQLADEIEHMQRYTEIEKIRFGHRLSVIYKINEDCFEELLPSFILQPIIENAIKYGLYGSIDDIQIKVTINKTPDNLFIVISNPFDLDSSQESGGTGYGLQSIRKKLLLIYKQSNLLSTRQENNIFITELTIPKS
ncbi:MAG: histidine kinase [Crocinitomicaceae bacterium]|nr:histidine kinase [Crocinitomicaceae bacterium]